jgi:hypothetical protein
MSVSLQGEGRDHERHMLLSSLLLQNPCKPR